MEEINSIAIDALKEVLKDKKKSLDLQILNLKSSKDNAFQNKELEIRKLRSEIEMIDELLADEGKLVEILSHIELSPKDAKQIYKSLEKVEEIKNELRAAEVESRNKQRSIILPKYKVFHDYSKQVVSLETEKDYYQEKIDNLNGKGIIQKTKDYITKYYYTKRINGIDEDLERLKSGKCVSWGRRVTSFPKEVVDKIRKIVSNTDYTYGDAEAATK